MSWYIVETRQGSVAIDGELNAHLFVSQKHAKGVWVTHPRPADPNDLSDRCAVQFAETFISDRRSLALS